MSFDLESHGDTVVLRMAGPKANAISRPWLAGLEAAVSEAVDREPAAMLLTGSGRMFSAGFDLPALVALDRAEMHAFMVEFAAVMEAVLSFPRPTVAAVNGHAVAGGCVLALMCDYRVMVADGASIGLKESAIGIGLPAIVLEPLRFRVPASSLAPIAMSGQLFDADEALGLGLVDDVVGGDRLLAASVERALALSAPPAAMAQIKAAMVRPLLEQIHSNAESELHAWLDTWFSPDGRRLVTQTVAALRR